MLHWQTSVPVWLSSLNETSICFQLSLIRKSKPPCLSAAENRIYSTEILNEIVSVFLKCFLFFIIYLTQIRLKKMHIPWPWTGPLKNLAYDTRLFRNVWMSVLYNSVLTFKQQLYEQTSPVVLKQRQKSQMSREQTSAKCIKRWSVSLNDWMV